MRVGDVVVCINNKDCGGHGEFLFVGEFYTITEIETNSNKEIKFVEVMSHTTGKTNWYFSYRFKLKVPYTKEDLL